MNLVKKGVTKAGRENGAPARKESKTLALPINQHCH
jgi:hypothetical protein